MDATLQEIRRQVLAGERLTPEQGVALFRHPDLHAVLALGDLARRLRHGQRVHYVCNRHINYSNVCVQRCSFCAFRRDSAEQEGAFTLSIAEIVARVAAMAQERPAELHIVGGCHPELHLAWFEELLRTLRAEFPDLVLKGFTVVEIAHLAELEGLPPEMVLRRLQAAGLAMLPGGGAEIFAPELRHRLCPTKLDGAQWLELSGLAHGLGLKSNCSMLFGHLETPEERVAHLDALRQQQDASGGFLCFVPLPFCTENNPLAEAQVRAGRILPLQARGLDILRTIAVARLMLDNIPHLKAYWVMLGLKTALAALGCGADDLDGTIVEEHIGRMAGADSVGQNKALGAAELEAAIRASGFVPVRRDGLFHPLTAEPEPPTATAPPSLPPGLLQNGAGAWRLGATEALELYQRAPLHELGRAAHALRLAKCPRELVTYVVDRNINYTNICTCGCRFCAFSVPPGPDAAQRGGYVLSEAELNAKIEETLALGGQQILLQGGCHPGLGLPYYETLLGGIRERFPQLHVHGFSPSEIVHLARLEGLSVPEVIARLRAAGLHSIPGGGAEILVERVRQLVSPGKCSAAQWLEVMRQAHLQGLRTTATMMYGHLETPEERVAHLLALRALQDETGGFTAFIPWAFQPEHTGLPRTVEPPETYLRTLALSRLVLDNVPNLQASWVTMGAQLAQVALLYGANDFGSTMIEENVVAAAGVRFRLAEDELRGVVRAAGFTPCRRRMDYSLLEEPAHA